MARPRGLRGRGGLLGSGGSSASGAPAAAEAVTKGRGGPGRVGGSRGRLVAKAALAVGCRVRVVALHEQPHLNGEVGSLEGFDPLDGSWQVRLGASLEVILPENLERVDEPAPKAEAGGRGRKRGPQADAEAPDGSPDAQRRAPRRRQRQRGPDGQEGEGGGQEASTPSRPARPDNEAAGLDAAFGVAGLATPGVAQGRGRGRGSGAKAAPRAKRRAAPEVGSEAGSGAEGGPPRRRPRARPTAGEEGGPGGQGPDGPPGAREGARNKPKKKGAEPESEVEAAEEELIAWTEDLSSRRDVGVQTLRTAFSIKECNAAAIRRLEAKAFLGRRRLEDGGRLLCDEENKVNVHFLLGTHASMVREQGKLQQANEAPGHGAVQDHDLRYVKWLVKQARALRVVGRGEIRRGKVSLKRMVAAKKSGVHSLALEANLVHDSDQEADGQDVIRAEGPLAAEARFPERVRSVQAICGQVQERLKAQVVTRQTSITATSNNGLDMQRVQEVLTAPQLSFDWEHRADEDDDEGGLEVDVPMSEAHESKRDIFRAQMKRTMSFHQAKKLTRSASSLTRGFSSTELGEVSTTADQGDDQPGGGTARPTSGLPTEATQDAAAPSQQAAGSAVAAASAGREAPAPAPAAQQPEPAAAAVEPATAPAEGPGSSLDATPPAAPMSVGAAASGAAAALEPTAPSPPPEVSGVADAPADAQEGPVAPPPAPAEAAPTPEADATTAAADAGASSMEADTAAAAAGSPLASPLAEAAACEAAPPVAAGPAGEDASKSPADSSQWETLFPISPTQPFVQSFHPVEVSPTLPFVPPEIFKDPAPVDISPTVPFVPPPIPPEVSPTLPFAPVPPPPPAGAEGGAGAPSARGAPPRSEPSQQLGASVGADAPRRGDGQGAAPPAGGDAAAAAPASESGSEEEAEALGARPDGLAVDPGDSAKRRREDREWRRQQRRKLREEEEAKKRERELQVARELRRTEAARKLAKATLSKEDLLRYQEVVASEAAPREAAPALGLRRAAAAEDVDADLLSGFRQKTPQRPRFLR